MEKIHALMFTVYARVGLELNPIKSRTSNQGLLCFDFVNNIYAIQHEGQTQYLRQSP